ncbi:MAG: histidine kinase [Lachnospiraceae bacterium]|nr:histidine kinase [Lachnospiraceae bacterium]
MGLFERFIKKSGDSREKTGSDRAFASEDTEKKDPMEELEIMKTRLVLSQIGPHFIYNVLNTIYYLCEKDTKLAQKAISDFSSYLRENMDFVKRMEPIPFSEEMDHVMKYLELEKLRYGDELQIEYDINITDFMVPALSVQAIVENAVRHGAGRLEDGGRIMISVYEGTDNYGIDIFDNGEGFDPDNIPDDGKSHTGIDNVRYLLMVMCGGTLTYIQDSNAGTHAIIRIPK